MAPARSVAPLLLVVAAFACGGSPGSDDAGATDEPATDASTAASTVDASAGESDSSAGETADEPACTAPPLTDEQLAKLAFGVFGNDVAAQPGESVALALGLRECCTTLEPVEVCASYRLTPETGATYDAAAGTLTVSADAAHGTVFELTADVEDGRATVKSVITVYTPEANPLVGTFQEIAQIDCKNAMESAPEPAMQELWFHADGTFSATWMPFETYFDYWGTYAFDVAKGTLDLTVDGGNYVPPDVDGSGTFRFDGDELVLEDMWLGAAQAFTGKPACGHRLAQ